jgi:uncharacterized protein YecT (DUF1311 family)
MIACCRVLIAAAACVFIALPASAQPAPDCSKAKTPAEQAICGNPDLSAADAAMGKAYAALFKSLPPEQQTWLRGDQRSWVTARDGGCFDQKDDALVKCLLAETDARRHFLLGEGDNGAVTGAPALVPTFFTEAKKGAYEITIAYPQIATAPKFNAAVHDVVFGKDVLAQYRADKPNAFNGSSNFYQVRYDATYLAPHLASVTFQFADYSGGAHPNNWRAAVLWNPETDKAVTFADIVADPDKAVPAISGLCKAKLSEQAKAGDWDFLDNPDFDAVVKDIAKWAVDKDGVTILFDPYAVTPYVVGPLECRLTDAELADWLKPGGPLPPTASR